MSKFISTDLTKYLLCNISDEQNQRAIAIQFIAADHLDNYLSCLSTIQSNWAKDNHFKASKNETLKLAGDDGELALILVGTGNDDNAIEVSTLAQLAKELPENNYFVDDDSLSQSDIKLLSIGWAIAQYEFDHYKEKKNSNNARLILSDEALFNEVLAIVSSIALVRDLVNTPTCDMGPSHLSEVMSDLAVEYQASFSEIVGEQLLEKNFNTIHAVGRAALNQPRLLELNWGREDAPKLTLVGKGVCFDTGGLDIKTGSGMRMMKKDMGGAAHTLGLGQMIMATGLDVHLRLLIPAVENNISADAFRPGDIIKTYKGTTVEVDNTDAEGRLVLCDALALASEQESDLIIDFATLTGAAKVAMGTDVVPFFTDNNKIANSLAQHGETENDAIWRMPLHTPYATQLKSNFADLKNLGTGPYGGAILAALFLKHFVASPENWIHFDMFAWNMSNKSTCPEGGEAMAIRAVFAFLQERYR